MLQHVKKVTEKQNLYFFSTGALASCYYCGPKYPISCLYSTSGEDPADFQGNSAIFELKSCVSLNWISLHSSFRDKIIVIFCELKILIPNAILACLRTIKV